MGKGVIIVTAIVLGGIAILTAMTVLPIYLLEKAECNRLTTDSQKRTEYRFIGGCYVEVNNRMIPKDNWRGEYEQ